mmetsp:Transcript_15494/g.35490  ORF Transcript_15494/g.35490 Transcript_15494/m.35490 type:complete len:139 (-) Transcript_15494:15-431(-)
MEVPEQEFAFILAQIDQCLLYRMCYVDDGCLYGDQAVIDKAKEDREKKFSIKKVGQLQENIGITVNEHTGGTITQSQPDIMAKLQRYFGADVEHMRQYETPMAAHRTVMRPDTKDQDVDWLSKQDPSKYRSGVGSLNY